MSISYHGNTKTGENYTIIDGVKSEVINLRVDDGIVSNQNALISTIKAAYLKGKMDKFNEILELNPDE